MANNRVEILLGYSTLRFHLTGMNAGSYDEDLLRRMEALIDSELEQGPRRLQRRRDYRDWDLPSRFRTLGNPKQHPGLFRWFKRSSGDKVVLSINDY